MSVYYVDSSGIVKLVVAEAGSDELRATLGDATLITSRVAVVEVSKAVMRVDPDVDVRATLEAFAFVELDDELAATAAATGTAALRALDAIHVASALVLGDTLTAFVTYDARQARAAADAGLAVISPGIEPAPSS